MTPAALGRAFPIALLTVACSGSVGDRPGGDNRGSGGGSPANPGQPGPGGTTPSPGASNPGGAGTQVPVPPGAVQAAVAPLRRLTADQYRNTVRDLLGLPERPAMALPADDAVADRFFSNTASALKSVDLDRYADAAEALAKKAVENVAALVPCDPRTGDAACAKSFIQRFGRRAYRRPLAAAELARMEKVYAAGGDFTGGIELVVTALLQSPKFLYLHEPVPASAAGKVVPVDAWALASRLSYFLLGTMPDDPLFEAAESGKLGSAEGTAAEAARLMKRPALRRHAGQLSQQWLSLHELGGAEKDPQLFPDPVWNPAVKAALAEESRRFVEYVLADGEGDGKLETLLAAPFSVLSDPLYAFYGLPRPAGAAAGNWQRVDLPKDQRAGLLTQGSLLASQAHADKTSYILRGKLVREALLCTPIPPPPPDAANVESKLPPTATARERAAEHRVRPGMRHLPRAVRSHRASPSRTSTPSGAGAPAKPTASRSTRRSSSPAPAAGRSGQRRGRAGAQAGHRRRGARLRDQAVDALRARPRGRGDDDNARKALATGFRDGGGKVRDLLAGLARSDAFRYQLVTSNRSASDALAAQELDVVVGVAALLQLALLDRVLAQLAQLADALGRRDGERLHDRVAQARRAAAAPWRPARGLAGCARSSASMLSEASCAAARPARGHVGQRQLEQVVEVRPIS